MRLQPNLNGSVQLLEMFFLFYTGIALKFFMKPSLVRRHLKNNTLKVAEKYFKFKITSNIIGKLITIHPYELMSS